MRARSLAGRAAAVLLGVTIGVAAAMRPAATATLDTVHVGRAIVTAYVFAMLEVGQDAHIWDSEGLKLDISSFRGDAQVQQALTAGSIDFGLGSGPAMGYREKGVPAIAVATILGPPVDMAIVVGKNSPVKTVADLKGKKLGVTTAGSLTDWLVHELSRKQGWGSDGIDSVAMGSTDARLAALESGQIAGSVQDTGVGYQLQDQDKGKILETFGHFVPKFETHVIFATDNMVNNHPDVVKRFLAGWFRTIAWAKTHKAQTVASVVRVLHESPTVVAQLYDTDMPAMSTDGSFDPAAVVAVAKSLKALGIMDTVPDPTKIYTTRFVPVKI